MPTSNDFFHGYFDWAATTPPDQAIILEAAERAGECFANPSSVHKAGLAAKAMLAEARERCAKALGVNPQNLVFTSGGTESDHWPLLSLLQRPQTRRGEGGSRGSVAISALEHPAVREMAESLKSCGFSVVSVMPEKDGRISAEQLLEKLRDDTLLVCVMAVNNETGCIQPVYQIADALRERYAGRKKPKFHVDAVQTAGKIPFCAAYPGIDSAAFSAHKLRGSRGIGLLYLAQRQEPFLRGGAQEGGLRAGTENVAGALAFASCLERYALTPPKASEAQNALEVPNAANAQALERYKSQIAQTSAFVEELGKIRGCGVIPACRAECGQEQSARLYSPWIVQASFEGIPGEVMVRALSERGFSISTGSACSSRKQSRPVLEAMGISKAQASTAVRFSFGAETTEQETQELLAALREVREAFK